MLFVCAIQAMSLPEHAAVVSLLALRIPVRKRIAVDAIAVAPSGGSVTAGNEGDLVPPSKRVRAWRDVDGGSGLNATKKDALLLEMGIKHFGKGPEGVVLGKLQGFHRWKNGGTESRPNKEGKTYRTLLCAYSVEAGCPFCIRVVENDGVYTIQDGGREHSDHSQRVGDRKVLFTSPWSAELRCVNSTPSLTVGFSSVRLQRSFWLTLNTQP